MSVAEIVTITIILITAATSYIGFQNGLNNPVFDRFCFQVGAVLGKSKQWDRLLTSALIHADWMHLLFNMMTLWFFAPTLIIVMGTMRFMAIYAGAILGGSLLSLWIHRKNYYYRAIGASGGVMGVIFAIITLYPNMKLGLFFIPVGIPAWLFGVIYLSISIYSLHKNFGNIGHDAHIGGAAVGLIITVIYDPNLLLINGIYILINFIPILFFLFYLRKK